MRLAILILLFVPFLGMSQSKTLIQFEKGEITPKLASSVERVGQGQLNIRFSDKQTVNKIDKIKAQLEKELASLGVKIFVQSDVIQLKFQGPDTPVLQKLSQIDLNLSQ